MSDDRTIETLSPTVESPKDQDPKVDTTATVPPNVIPFPPPPQPQAQPRRAGMRALPCTIITNA
jgi:hypothetical protein